MKSPNQHVFDELTVTTSWVFLFSSLDVGFINDLVNSSGVLSISTRRPQNVWNIDQNIFTEKLRSKVDSHWIPEPIYSEEVADTHACHDNH